MTARRQASTTSLSKYARANSPDLSNRSLDFCNAFWGVGDAGVDVLFARMRGASRTMEELRSFWKERSAIEEDYAKKLTKLAKMTLGKDEIGELRNTLDTIRLETDKQAGFHSLLAQQIHDDLEGQTNTFRLKQMHHKKNYQAIIEKQFKSKQTHESYVNKAREKYESDCLRINSYTAQSTLVQGKELEKLHLKLERAQQTVQANERDYANFTKALAESTEKWEADWKLFCDSCQDLEEERISFMKDNMWAYANAVSTVCVSDDESCERARLALEQLMPERDMENFVRDYGTGNSIPDPPAFLNYSNPDAVASASRTTARLAHFQRVTRRENPIWYSDTAPVEDEPLENTAGIGAGGGSRKGEVQSATQITRSGTTASSRTGESSSYNANAQGSSSVPGPVQSTDLSSPPDSADSTVDLYAKASPSASKGGAQQGSTSYSSDNKAAPEVDPLVKQLEALKEAASSGASGRRNSIWNKPDNAGGSVTKTQVDPNARTSTSPKLPPTGQNTASAGPSSNTGPARDYRNSAEIVVGAYPGPSSRSVSPQPPTAVFMAPPPRAISPAMSDVPVEDIVSGYQSSLPGERKSVSRSNSRNNSFSDGVRTGGAPPVTSPGQNQAPRSGPGSTPGYASTAPNHAAQSPTNPANAAVNSTGVTLDLNGRVLKDSMAERFLKQQPGAPLTSSTVPPQGDVLGRPNQVYGNPGGYGTGGSAVSYPTQPQPVPYHPVTQAQPNTQYYGANANVNGVGLNRNPSYQAGYGHQSHPSQQMQTNQPQYGHSPPPQPPPQPPFNQPQTFTPTGQTTEDGRGILFYVKALYDYQATIEEEFDFQAGDIIAVTATPDDGWWSGELLDEARRQPGRHVFPSNFVCLF